MNKIIKAIIFDMDGVLVDATEWHYEALNRALKTFGFEITRREHIERYNGLPTRTKLKMLTEEKGLPESLHKFVNDLKQKYTSEEVMRSCEPDIEKIKMMRTFKSQQFKIAVCSNAIRASVEGMLKRSNLFDFCEFFLSNQDVKNPKPSPEMYITAIKKLNFSPTECLIIEDSPRGLESARASGAHVMEVEGYNEVNYKNIRRVIDSLSNSNR